MIFKHQADFRSSIYLKVYDLICQPHMAGVCADLRHCTSSKIETPKCLNRPIERGACECVSHRRNSSLSPLLAPLPLQQAPSTTAPYRAFHPRRPKLRLATPARDAPVAQDEHKVPRAPSPHADFESTRRRMTIALPEPISEILPRTRI